jgi:hypothetical protein
MSSLNKRLITLGVLAVLAAGAFLVVQFVEFGGQEEEVETADLGYEMTEPLFPRALYDVVTSIRVTDNKTGQVFSAVRDIEAEDPNTWEILESVEGSDTGLGVDGASLSGAVASLPTLYPNRVLSEIEMMATYGLDEPGYTIHFETSGGYMYTLYVGSENPEGSAYYVRLLISPNTVYLVSTFTLDIITVYTEDPPYIQPTPTGEPTQG